jgi:hypothetical protein
MLELTCKLIQRRRTYNISALIMAAAVMLAFMGTATATAIPGATPQWNGSNLSVAVTMACLNFFNASIDACPPGTSDIFTLNAPSDAIFGTVGSTTGTTKDYLAANQASFAPGTVQPYTGGTAFMTLNGFTFDVTSINVPAAVPCPPSATPGSCTIEDVVLTQLDLAPASQTNPCVSGLTTCGHVTVGFSSNGIGYSGSSSTGSTPFTFSYSSQFNGETIADLLAKAAAGQIQDSVSITANGVNAAVPEPMAFSLMGLGLAALGIYGRRARSKRA